MAQVKFPVRLLGYDRKAVLAVLASTQDQLRRAETRRDEVLSASANVERIGAQVADMLRTLADRAAALEAEAAVKADEVVQGALLDAAQVRAQAATALAAAEAQAQQLVESAHLQHATVVERRETALVSLQIAIDQMGRLATTIDQIDLTAAETLVPPQQSEPGLRVAEDETGTTLLMHGPPASVVDDDPIAPALSRIDAWAHTS